jgi:NDP-sugar pyrophosphorylase family protein
MTPTLVVLAAGMGSRYGGLKQVAPVNATGDTIVDYSVYDAVRAGFDKVVFVIRKEIAGAFKATIGARFKQHLEIAYAFQELDSLPPGFAMPNGRTKPWGTLHATLIGAEKIIGPFAVINADDFYGAESFRVLSQHLQQDAAHCAMVGFTLRNTLSDFGSVSRGVCSVDGNGLLLSTVEKTKIVRDGSSARSVEANGEEIMLSGDEIVSMNMWGFTPAVVPLLRQAFLAFLQECGSDLKVEAYLPKAMNHMVVDEGVRVDVLRTNDTWCGVTYPEDHAHVVDTIVNLTREGKYPEKLWP